MTYRNIDTSMWKDGWFLDLEPEEKLLFIYFFSNDNTMLTGLYKISLKVIQFETALPIEFIRSTLDKFSAAGKVHYDNGVVWVVNLRKYNDSKSPKVATRIAWELSLIPDCPLKNAYLNNKHTLSNQDNTPSIQYGYSIDTDPTLTLTNQTISLTEQIINRTEQASPPTSNPPDDFDQLKSAIEQLTGYPCPNTAKDIAAINDMLREGIEIQDCQAGIAWLVSNGKVARGPASLIGSARTSKARRVQAETARNNGGSEPSGRDPIQEAGYVWIQDLKRDD